MKKTFGLLLVITLIAASVVGCSKDEKEFLKLVDQVSSLRSIEVEGEMEFSTNDEFVSNLITNESDMIYLKDFLNGFELKYKGYSSKDKKEIHFTYEYRLNKNEDYKFLTEFIVKDKDLYIKTDKIVKILIERIDQETLSEKEKKDFQKIKNLDKEYGYIKIDLEKEIQDIDFDRAINNEFKYSDFLLKAFDNFDTNLIDKSVRKYTFKIDSKKFLELIKDFLTYLSDDSNALIKNLNDLYQNNQEYRELLKLQGYDKKQYYAFLKEMQNLTKNSKLYLNNYNKFLESEEKQEVLDVFNNSYFSYSLKKNSKNTYKSGMDLNVNITDLNNYKFRLKNESFIKEVKEYDLSSINVPLNVITFEQLEDKFKEEVKKITVNLESGKYIKETNKGINESYINYILDEDDNIYLPAIVILSDLDEDIKWNKETNFFEMKRDGEIITFETSDLNGKKYIKINNLEKVGYKLDINKKLLIIE